MTAMPVAAYISRGSGRAVWPPPNQSAALPCRGQAGGATARRGVTRSKDFYFER